MRWKRCDRRSLAGTEPDRFAVAAVFRGKHKLVLAQIEVTVRPAVVGVALELYQFFGGLIGALLRRIETRPVFPQLIATMLGGEEATRGIECDTFSIGQPGDDALAGRQLLSGPGRRGAPSGGARHGARAG